jgi:protein-disulfide isomerase
MQQPLSRRALVRGALSLGVGGIAASMLPRIANAQRGPATVPVEELMKPGDLPDLSIGKPDSSVTIVEYASMTCPHCANFHVNVYPQIKQKYLDTGKARLIFREFPLDNLAAAVSMLARCVGGGEDGAMSFVSDMFKNQERWAFERGNPVPKLFEMAKQAGFTQESFDKCLTDQKLLDQVTAVRERASTKFGVNSTPTFFINGRRLNGVGMADFEKAIDPLLKS